MSTSPAAVDRRLAKLRALVAARGREGTEVSTGPTTVTVPDKASLDTIQSNEREEPEEDDRLSRLAEIVGGREPKSRATTIESTPDEPPEPEPERPRLVTGPLADTRTREPEPPEIPEGQTRPIPELAKAAGRGVGQLIESGGRILEQPKILGPAEKALQPPVEVEGLGRETLGRVGSAISTVGRSIAESERLAPAPELAADAENLRNPLWWLTRGAEVVPQLGAAVAGGAATGVAGFAAPIFALEAAGAYDEAKQRLSRTMSPEAAEEAASQVGAVVGAGNAALESLLGVGVGRVFESLPLARKLFRRELLKRAPLRTGATASEEALEEAVQGAWNATVQSVAARDPEAFQEFKENVGVEAGVGALVGGVFGAANVGIGRGQRAAEPARGAQPEPAPVDRAAEETIEPEAEPVVAEEEPVRPLLRAAIRAEDGTVFVTKPGERLHAEIVGRVPRERFGDIDRTEAFGFVDEEGNFLNREEAFEIVQPSSRFGTAAEPGLQARQLPLEEVEPDEILRDVAVEEIDLEPDRFQFKRETGEGGAGPELRNVRQFDPRAAGVVYAWRDPEDGRLKTVNGHNRVALAKRLGAESMPIVEVLNVPTAQDARTVGALINIKEGNATEIDAAKVFRDNQFDRSDLEEMGIALRDNLAERAFALSNLAGPLFNAVATGDMRVNRGVLIGESELSESQQLDLVRLIDSRERGRTNPIPDRTIRELIAEAGSAQVRTEEQETLFGTEQIERTNLLEKAEIAGRVRSHLASEARTFGFLTRGGRAEQIEQAEAGEIDVERAGEIATGAEQAVAVFDRLKGRQSPINDILNEAASRVAEGESVARITEEVAPQITAEVKSLLQGEEPAGREAGGEAGAQPPDLFAESTELPSSDDPEFETVKGSAVANESGFARLIAREAQPERPSEQAARAGTAEIKVEVEPRRPGFFDRFRPVFWLGRQMERSGNPATAAVGRKISALYRASRDAMAVRQREIAERDVLVREVWSDLSKSDKERLLAALDTHAFAEDLLESFPDHLREGFERMREFFRDDYRRIGELNIRLMGEERARIIQQAVETWPDEWPDFNVVPGNRDAILAAANLTLDSAPETREGWEELARANNRRARFLDFDSDRATFGMLTGQGGITAYFPHVFHGQFKVKAGVFTKYFPTIGQAIDYARSLKSEEIFDDPVVARQGFTPDLTTTVSRSKFFATANAIEQALEPDVLAANQAIQESGLVPGPRRRFNPHERRREVGLQTFERDAERALKIYNYRMASKFAFDPLRFEAERIKSPPRAPGVEPATFDEQPLPHEWRKWADRYIGFVQGRPSETTEELNNFIEHLAAVAQKTVGSRIGVDLSTKPMPLNRWAGKWQNTMGFMFLGYSPTTAALNLTQTAIDVTPALGKGGERRVLKAARRLANSDAESRRILDEAGVGLEYPKFLVGQFMPSDGLDATTFRDRLAPFYMFNKAEKVNRAIAALGGYEKAREEGAGHAQAIEAAKELNTLTNFDYSNANLAMALQNPIGKAFAQFLTFPHNQVMLSYEFARTGDVRAAAKHVAYLTTFGGLVALAVQSPLWILNWLLGKTGAFGDDDEPDRTPQEALADKLVEQDAPQWVVNFAEYGLPGLFGIDFSGRVGFAGADDIRTVPTTILQKVRALATATTDTERIRAAIELIPNLQVQRLVKAIEIAQTGEFRSRFGNLLAEDVSVREALLKGIGFQPIERSRQFEQFSRRREVLEDVRSKKQKWVDRLARRAREQGIESEREFMSDPEIERMLVEAEQDAGVSVDFQDVQDRIGRQDAPAIVREIRSAPDEIREHLYTDEQIALYCQHHPSANVCQRVGLSRGGRRRRRRRRRRR